MDYIVLYSKSFEIKSAEVAAVIEAEDGNHAKTQLPKVVEQLNHERGPGYVFLALTVGPGEWRDEAVRL